MGLAALCVRRPVFTTMLVMALVVLGLISFRSLGVDLYPRVDIPTITIQTVLPGASAEEIETEVTRPIEEAVNTIQGIDELRSVTREGVSLVIVSFVLERETDQAAQDVRDKIAMILGNLPDGVEPPVIQKVDPDASPILSVTLSGGRSLREITEIADKQIKQQLESVAGIGQVLLTGGRERAIQLEIDAERLNALGLSVGQVATALRRQNIEVPGGRLEQGQRELVVRTLGRVSAAEQFAEVVVSTRDGIPIRVKDFARVEDSWKQPRDLARLDGQDAVTMLIRKQSGTNTIRVIEIVKERLGQIQAALPPDLKLDVIRDQSIFIKASVEAIYEHLFLGGLLASLVVFVFMGNWRASLIAALAIPTSLIATFLMMQWAGFTLNTITLLALTVAVGIVIDDAIVVLENIFRYIEEKGYEPFEAAIAATREIGLAVMATTLSLIVIFLPVIFLGGVVGRWLQSFGYTAAFAIGISMLISFTLTPMLSSRYLKVKKKDNEGQSHHSSKDMKVYQWIEARYIRMLEWSLGHRKTVILVCTLTFLSMIPLGMLIGKDFITNDDQNEFEVAVKTAEGTSLEGTEAILREVEDHIRQLPHVQHLLTTAGSATGGGVTTGSVYVRLTEHEERDETQFELMDRARASLQQIPGVILSVQNVGAISTSAWRNTPVNVGVRGPDLKELSRLSSIILERLKGIPILRDVDTSLNYGNPEVHITVNREKAADLGVDVTSIAETMRLMLSGETEITKFKEGDELYEVLMRVRPEQRKNPDSLGSLMAPTAAGRLVRLDNVATVERGTGPVQIDRYNRQRQVTFNANLETGAPLGQALEDTEKIIQEVGLPVGYDYVFIGFGKIFQDLIGNFLVAFILAFVFMYMVLAAQFESFVHPLTILASLPLAVPFALIALFFTGQSLSMFGAIGILLLFGVVKKNSILQIDFTNRLRREHGYDRHKAIIEANRARLRPILMTTLSIIVAMIPTALGTGAGASTRAPIGVVIAGGQTLCFLLTLLAIPVVYTIFDDMAQTPVRERARAWKLALGRSFSGFFGMW